VLRKENMSQKQLLPRLTATKTYFSTRLTQIIANCFIRTSDKTSREANQHKKQQCSYIWQDQNEINREPESSM